MFVVAIVKRQRLRRIAASADDLAQRNQGAVELIGGAGEKKTRGIDATGDAVHQLARLAAPPAELQGDTACRRRLWQQMMVGDKQAAVG